ncbi:MAG: 5-formyltetrahydrofolate cyclo-ligase [Pseudomonadota bacterium]|nr:5-formyltetrahydrofolate cyclo-ligase [Pseudomonadota bacterium]
MAPPLRFLTTGRVSALSRGIEKVDQEKSALRVELRRRRSKAHSIRGPAAATALASRFLTHFGETIMGDIVAGYWPMKDEIDIRPVLNELANCSATAALPLVMGREEPLTFRQWSPGDRLLRGDFGVSQPNFCSPVVVPDIVIVPMLGFDASGNRLGYGEGYYDRTLGKIRGKHGILTVGVAYDEQECEKIPVEVKDVPLDTIMTDRRTITPAK